MYVEALESCNEDLFVIAENQILLNIIPFNKIRIAKVYVVGYIQSGSKKSL